MSEMFRVSLAVVLFATATHAAPIRPTSFLALRLCSDASPFNALNAQTNTTCELNIEEWDVTVVSAPELVQVRAA